jgi:hypothetical protein
VAILLGCLIAGEDLTPMQIAGIVIVLSSISVAIISKSAQAARASKRLAEEPAERDVTRRGGAPSREGDCLEFS